MRTEGGEEMRRRDEDRGRTEGGEEMRTEGGQREERR